MKTKRAGRPAKPTDESTFIGQIGARIRARREACKLTVEQAATSVDIPVPSWYHAEAGRHLTLDRLPAIATALGCSVRSLIP